ncbi:MAG: DsbE family thiol:disulfide interchange protein [Alphaproteobacteria bacterium]|nr:DsbE family thiol:disulfide interchange protein [Alphaproteobacteria bacterium]
MRRLVFLMPLIVIVALVGTLAWPILEGRDPRQLPSVLLDKPIPAFELPGLMSGGPGLASAVFTGPDRLGKPALLNVFASWCAPCRLEIPRLAGLAAEGVAVYGLAYKDDPAATLGFLEQLGNPYHRIGVDRDGRVAIDFGVYGVPETYVIDAEGRIRHRHVGEITDQVARETLVPLLESLTR